MDSAGVFRSALQGLACLVNHVMDLQPVWDVTVPFRQCPVHAGKYRVHHLTCHSENHKLVKRRTGGFWVQTELIVAVHGAEVQD